MSTVYKKFTPQDYAIVPFNAHKQYNFVSSSASSNSINHYTGSWTSESIDLYNPGAIKYNQIDNLFYRNFNKIHNVSTGEKYFGHDDLNYLKHQRKLYEHFRVLSIPMGLYGAEIKPKSFYLKSDNIEIVDDGYGNLIKYSEKDSINTNYETDVRSRVLDIGPINGFKRYDLNVYDGYTVDGIDQYFYLDGVKRINPISSYSTPEGDEYDDSYFYNLIQYKNVNFSKQTLNSGDFPCIDFNDTISPSIKVGHKGDFNFNPGDDFTISFWTNVKPPTVGQLIINTNNITASAAGNENLTLISSDGTTVTYRCTAGANASNLGSGITSIQWKIAQATANKDDVKATNLANAINGSTGHNGKLVATAVNDVVTIKQLNTPPTIGTIGNTTVTATAQFNQKVDGSVSSTFTLGTDVDYYLISKSTTKEANPGNFPELHNSASNPYNTPYEIEAEPQFPFEVYAFNKEIFFKRSDGNITTTYSASYTPGTQQHITCRCKDSQMEIFINGVGSGISGSDNTIKQTQNTANIYIGNKGDKEKYLSGSISQIQIYNKSLTNTQITSHYNHSNSSPYIGNVFYKNGFVTITHPKYLGMLDATGNGTIQSLQFQGSHQIYEHEYQCTIEEHEFNNTSNISARKIGSTNEEEIAGFQTSLAFKPYVTTIGLYNENNELLIVGKLAQPVRMSNETDTTFVVRWDS